MTMTLGFGAGGGDDRLDAGLGHHLEPVLRQVKATGAHGNLLLRFLAGDIQRREALSDGTERLQEDRGLADARVAADQHHRAVHQATAEHAVQLAGGGGEARHFLDADFGQGLDVGLVTSPAGASRGGWGGSTTVSTSVFHAPQSPHWPAHLGVEPHSVQPYMRLALAMGNSGSEKGVA